MNELVYAILDTSSIDDSQTVNRSRSKLIERFRIERILRRDSGKIVRAVELDYDLAVYKVIVVIRGRKRSGRCFYGS